MYFREYEDEILLDEELVEKYGLRKVAFFDIETTGFNKVSDIIMLISLGYFDKNKFITKQYFAEYIEDEVNILKEFKENIKEFDIWCSYNGIAFDEPYVIKKMDMHNIEFNCPGEHIDLYRKIKPYQKQLGLERCNLKSVEKYLGVNRKDKIDGEVTVQLYKQYVYTNNDSIRDTIMLHNYEDVLNLPILFKALHEIETNPRIKKEPNITENQLRYLKILIRKNNMKLESNLKCITKKAASKAIDAILKGNYNSEEVDFIIKDTF